MGSYAGLDLIEKIYDNTPRYKKVKTDQDHLSVLMFSLPSNIGDRTAFLQNPDLPNPGDAIAAIVEKMIALPQGFAAEVIGIPCNTAHSPEIFSQVQKKIPPHVKLVHLLKESAKFLQTNYPSLQKVGVLATNGTVSSKVYSQVLEAYNIETLYPEPDLQTSLVHNSIYSNDYGIKTFSKPVTDKAVENLHKAAELLVQQGAQAIILGCTEIPLAFHEKVWMGKPVIDATEILAHALIRASLDITEDTTEDVSKKDFP